ncbi:uncharacterized protein LOC141950862 [Strix uralensis]|uniref:uncharacterized protein LOC141950862 n=1 Tax=Strix uralensis TaxID=36305 RepID=UPI003DA5A13C
MLSPSPGPPGWGRRGEAVRSGTGMGRQQQPPPPGAPVRRDARAPVPFFKSLFRGDFWWVGGGVGTRQKHRCLPVTSGARAARVPPQPVQSSGSRAPVPPGPPCAPRSFQRANNGGKRRIAENNRNEPHSLPTSGLGPGPGASPREGRGFARSGGGCGTSGFPSLKLHTVVLAAKDPEVKAITDPKGMASSFGPRKHACLKTKTSGMEKICQCVVSVQIFYDASNKTKFAFAGSTPHMYMTC